MSYAQMMKTIDDNTLKAKALWRALHGNLNDFDLGPQPSGYASQVSPKGGPVDFKGLTIKAVSISYPPDKRGYVETALIGADGKLIYIDDLGYDDVVVHDDTTSLVAHLNALLRKIRSS